jgi:hypothetical protein
VSERQRHVESSLEEAVAVCHGVLWLANNIHHYGGDQWREYFMACVRDARRVVGYESEQDTA